MFNQIIFAIDSSGVGSLYVGANECSVDGIIIFTLTQILLGAAWHKFRRAVNHWLGRCRRCIRRHDGEGLEVSSTGNVLVGMIDNERSA